MGLLFKLKMQQSSTDSANLPRLVDPLLCTVPVVGMPPEVLVSQGLPVRHWVMWRVWHRLILLLGSLPQKVWVWGHHSVLSVVHIQTYVIFRHYKTSVKIYSTIMKLDGGRGVTFLRFAGIPCRYASDRGGWAFIFRWLFISCLIMGTHSCNRMRWSIC